MPFTPAKATSILTSNIAPSHYIGLSTTTPTATGGNFTEPSSSTGYARQKFGDQNSGNGEISNKYIIFFFEALENCGTFTHFGIFNSASGGTPHFYGSLTSNLTVNAGYVPLIRAGELVITLD